MKRMVLCVSALMIFSTISQVAQAKKNRELTYSYTQVWGSAIRFLRVDMGYRVFEKDKKSGYVLFDYAHGAKNYNGSIELIPGVRNGKRHVRFTVRIPQMPSYVEAVLLDKLMRKLKDEHGEPPPAQLVLIPENQGKSSGKKAKAGSGVGEEPPADEDDINVSEEELEDSQKE